MNLTFHVYNENHEPIRGNLNFNDWMQHFWSASFILSERGTLGEPGMNIFEKWVNLQRMRWQKYFFAIGFADQVY
jgi:hypothetical protein